MVGHKHEKLHWYHFAFQHSNKEEYSTKTVLAASYLGLHLKNVSMVEIEAAKKAAVIDKSAVMMSCSYLGHMSDDDFRGVENSLYPAEAPPEKTEQEISDELKAVAMADIKKAELSTYAYFCACPVGRERYIAADIYENIRTSTRVN